MFIEPSLLAFFRAFLVALFILSFVTLFVQRYWKIPKERKEGKRVFKKQALRWGGGISGIFFLVSLIADPHLIRTPDIMWLMGGCAGMLCVGWWDDIRALDWKWQLFWQVGIIGAILFFADIRITDIPNLLGGRWFFEGPWAILGFFGAFFWFILVINALNWIDGIDGLAPGIIVISLLTLGFLSLRPEVFQPPLALIAFSCAGFFAGLWLLNIYPARFSLGTSGVYGAGFVLAYLSLFAGAKVATAFLVLALPILDVFRVLFWRYTSKKHIAHPDTNHIHHVFLARGWSESRTSFVLLCIIVCMGFFSLFLGAFGKSIVLFLFLGGFFLFVAKEFWERKKYNTKK